jgi:hypothetical protein
MIRRIGLSFAGPGYEKAMRRWMFLRATERCVTNTRTSRVRRFFPFATIAIVPLVVIATAGCSDLGGGGTAGSQKDGKPSRDVDEQVDAVMKDFKNE